MARLHTRIWAASLALALSVHAVSGEQHHAARKTTELQYRLVEIPDFTPDGRQGLSTTISINDRGEVLAVGSRPPVSENDPLPTQVFIWRRGQVVTELSSPDPAFPWFSASRINNRSEVVGTIIDSPEAVPAPTARAFVWRRGRFTVLGPLPSTGGSTWGDTINDWGEVAGTTLTADFLSMTYRWFRGRFDVMPTAAMDPAIPLDINNRGQVTGMTWTSDFHYRGFVWSRKGTVRFLDPLPGGGALFPRAINDRGQVVGFAGFPAPSGSHAFLWEDGTVLDLGTLPGTVESEAQAINEFGTVVGYARPSVVADTAMLWRDGELHDLNDLVAADDPLKSRVRLTGAGDINNFGWIAAGGFDSTYEPWQQRGYVLIPVWKRRN
jgi:probable HAF family extracellular repeat protein